MNIAVLNTKGGVGKSFISTQILPLAFYNNNNTNINIFEVDNNNKTTLQTDVIEFLNLNINNIDKILLDVQFSDNINIIDSGGGDDTKNVIKSLSENSVEIDVFIVPILKDFEVSKNLIDTINLIKQYYNNVKIVVALNKVVSDAKQEFIYFFGSDELNVESIIDKLDDDISVIAIKDYNEIDIIKNLHKTTALDAILQYQDVLENEADYKQKWIKEAKEFSDDKDEQREYFADKMKKLLLIKRLNNIKNNIQEIFKQIKDS